MNKKVVATCPKLLDQARILTMREPRSRDRDARIAQIEYVKKHKEAAVCLSSLQQ